MPEDQPDLKSDAWQTPPVTIVGAGPVGVRLAAELVRLDPTQPVALFGEEQWQPYNRVQLSSYLTGDIGDLVLHEQLPDAGLISMHLGTRITRIDRDKCEIIDMLGNHHRYSTLVLATGSRAFVPPIPDVELAGVYTFRNLDDATKLKARSVRSQHTVVIGGGLLGLETARGMLRHHTRVTVVEQTRRLMFHQLDDDCASVLDEHITDMGIKTITDTSVASIDGDTRVESVQLSNGQRLDCDTVVIAAGIRPNIELAQDCGLKIGRGVRVDDSLQTSDPRIYAVGECAEHRKRVYGLVQPGFEQASVAAQRICGEFSYYAGSLTATRLKVVGLPVMSVGELERRRTLSSWWRDRLPGGFRKLLNWERRTLSWGDPKTGGFRRLYLDGNHLDAAMGVGDWEEFSRIQEGVSTRRRIWPWHLLRFYFTGVLWEAPGNVANWPATATVCNCKGVTRGELTAAFESGCTSVDSLSRRTGASTGCGSCRPLLAQLTGAVASLEPVRAAKWLTGAGILVALAALFSFLPLNMNYAASVQGDFSIDMLWRDSLLKQISGFTLLGMSVLLAFVSLRKRVSSFTWGSFDGWRLVHVLVGVVTLLVLVAHTGLRMGNNINFYLMFVFSGLVLAGAIAGFATGMQHVLPLSVARGVRSMSVWTHILLLWPLPALLGFHILKTYWY